MHFNNSIYKKNGYEKSYPTLLMVNFLYFQGLKTEANETFKLLVGSIDLKATVYWELKEK